MSDTGWVSPGTMADDRSWSTYSNTHWNNVSNATASDDTYVTLVTTDGVDNISYYLEASNFGFNIPVGATIDGIEFRVECKSTSVNTLDEGKIVDGEGTLLAANDRGDASINTTEKYIYFGGSTELWGASWDYTDINSSSFGCAILDRIIFGDQTISVDHIQIKVYYTESGNVNDEIPGFLAGGHGRYVEDFSTTTKKDGTTTASWTGDGSAEML
jgi:hypothetical protein